MAKALANKVFPVPGGPYNKTPFHGRLMPTKKSGINKGKTTASVKALFAVSNSAISSKLTFGFMSTTSLSTISIRSVSGP